MHADVGSAFEDQMIDLAGKIVLRNRGVGERRDLIVIADRRRIDTLEAFSRENRGDGLEGFSDL